MSFSQKKHQMNIVEIIKKNWLLLVILLGATLLRVYQLGFLSIWVDEYIHVLNAKKMVEGIPLAQKGNGVLLTLSIYPFFKLFGVNDFMARLPSLIYGVLSLFVMFKIAKRLFNKEVAYLTVLLLAVSQYHVFWSRIARNYAIIGFFFPLMIYFFIEFFEPRKEAIKTDFFKKIDISEKYLVLFFLAFIGAFFSHPITFFVFFGIGLYTLFVFVSRSFKKETRNFKDKYAIMSYLFIIGTIMVFMPAFEGVIKGILGIFLPANAIDWIIPNAERLSMLTDTKKHEIFNMYYDVLKTDYSSLYLLGVVGFIAQFFINKKSAMLSLAFFGYLFLLMSYVYREPALPRYIFFIFPFFAMAIASSLYVIYFKLLKKVLPEKLFNSHIVKAVLVLAILFVSPLQKSIAMVKSTEHGKTIPKALSHWYFTNWKEASQNVKKEIKDTDMVISTGTMNVAYYLDLNEAIHYRQNYYNTATHAYEPVDVSKKEYPHANSFEGVKEIYDKNDRGWMITDYYFDGVFSDPKTRSFLINNATYRYDLSNSDIKVLQWDKTKKLKKNSLLEILTPMQAQSKEYFVNYNNAGAQTLTVLVEAEGLQFSNELQVILNRKTALSVDVAKGSEMKGSYDNAMNRQYFSIPISAKLLQNGRNSIIFQMNARKPSKSKKKKKSKLKEERVAVYDFRIQ